MAALNVVPDGTHPKKAFDLSNYDTNHLKGGMFQVVGVRDTVPNSQYRMSVDSLTKTLLCNTANFAHIKENYYFVHVPLGLISRNSYQMLVDRKQSYTSLDMDTTQFPVFDLAAVVNECLCYGAMPFDVLPSKYMDVHGFNICANAIRLLDQLGYGYFGDFLMELKSSFADTYKEHPTYVASDFVSLYTGSRFETVINARLNGVKPSVARIAAYQCVWYSFFRNDIYDNSITARCYNFDDVTYITSGTANFDVTADANRGVDNFIIECLQMRYNPYKKDLFMSSLPGTQFGAASTVSLMDDVVFSTDISPVTSSRENILTSAVSKVSSPSSPDVTLGTIVVTPPNSVTGEYGDLVSSYAPDTASGDVFIRTPHTHSVSIGSGTATLSSGTSLFDVLSLVESQAIQKWRQKSMLAGNKTVDQFRAHHGVVPRHLIDHLPDFIGSVDNEIMIKEITSQANTLNAEEGENNLGEIRGRGYGASDNRTFNFYSDDYGILLLLHTIVPENTYSSYGLEKGNMMIYYSDFFQQEYENIGLESVPKIMLNTLCRYPFPELVHGQGSDDFADSYDEGNIGYAPRNYGYKQYPSKVHGLFNPNRVKAGFNQASLDVFGYSDMQSFVLTRNDMVGQLTMTSSSISYPTLTMSLSKLYVNPSVFDSIFAFAADDWFDSDPFITHARFNCQAMLPMSVIGLPQF